MRRVTAAVTLGIFVLMAHAALATEMRQGATIITMDGTYVSMVTEPAVQTSYGSGGILSYEKLSSDANWTAGFRFHYFKVTEDYKGAEQQNVNGEYNDILLQLLGRYFLDLNPTFKAYAGVGLGFKFTTFTITTDGSPFEDNESNFSLSLPVGVDTYLTKNVFINLGYTFNFLATTSYLRHDIVNSFQAGIGFQFGGGGAPEEKPAENDETGTNEEAPTVNDDGGR